MKGCPSSHVHGSRGCSQVNQIEGVLDVSVGGCGGPSVKWSCWRILSTSHPVIKVVGANYWYIYVPTGSVNEMVASDGEEVSIPADHHHFLVLV